MSALKAVLAALGPEQRAVALSLQMVAAEQGGARAARYAALLVDAWLRDRVGRRRYRLLDEGALVRARKSDTAFVFGSGSSLNDIPDDEWERFARHDVIGFNAFYEQRWVPVDFHILRGGVYGELRWRPHAEEVRAALAGNPLYAGTIFVMQDDLLGFFANALVGHGLLPRSARLARYHSLRGAGPPSRRFSDGLRHDISTLDDAVNLAYCLGFKEIVLVGVDLYDTRYFWLPSDMTLTPDVQTGRLVMAPRNELHGNRFDETHNTVRNGVVEQMEQWGRALAEDGVVLTVYNERSLLAEVLPVHARPTAAQARP